MKEKLGWVKNMLGWLLFLSSIVGSLVLSFWLAEKIHVSTEVWQRYGCWGISLGALASNATVVFPLPFPLLPFALKLAEQTDPLFLGIFYVAVFYAAGAALGELSGYAVGFSTGGVLRKWIGKIVNNRHIQTVGKASGLRKISNGVREGGEVFYGMVERKIGFKQKIPGLLKRHGGLAIVVLAAVPSPFDFLGILLGSMKYPWWKFLIFTFLGRIPKYCFAIYLLYLGINLVFH